MARLIAALLMLIASLFIPILFTIYTPIYDEQNTQTDQGTIVSIETQKYGLSPAKMTVYTLDNGNRYYIPSGFNPYVDSFSFQNKSTELSLRYDSQKERHNAFVIVMLFDEEETFLSIDRINSYERLSRILVWCLYCLTIILLLFVLGNGDLCRLIFLLKNKIRKEEKKKRIRKKE